MRQGRVFVCLLLLLVQGVSCLASTSATELSSSSSSSSSYNILSINKNGGHSKIYVLSPYTAAAAATTASTPPPPYSTLSSLQHFQQISFPQILAKVKAGLRSTFLPAGYSANMPTGYMSYAVMSWVQDLSTQLRSVLATQKVLEGVGVGREGATALSALLQFLVRDGCGMAATLLFTSAAASKFKADVKRWRLLADIMVDTGITLEILAAQVPAQWFLPLLCVGNMCKAICGVAAGACGGAIHLHWASQAKSDIADIQAKFGAQHTVTGSLGLIFAALFARSVAKMQLPHLWILYSVLTAIHIGANRECMRLIAFDNLNTLRLDMLLEEFWEQRWKDETNSTEVVKLSSPDQVARTEPLLFLSWRRHRPSPFSIHFGVSFNELIQKAGRDSHEVRVMLSTQEKSPYWVLAAKRGRRRPFVMVALQRGIHPYDQTKAYFHAVLLSRYLARQNKETRKCQYDIEAAEKAAARDVDEAWGKFAARCMIAGWDLSATEIQTRGFEIQIKQNDVSI